MHTQHHQGGDEQDDSEEEFRLNRKIERPADAHIAVLDPNGTIVAVNEGWQQFAAANGGPVELQAGVGLHYPTVCQNARGEYSAEAPSALQGILEILSGRQSYFTLEYPCNAPHEKRWFLLIATALTNGSGGAITCHINITEYRKMEAALHRLSETHEHIQELAELQHRLIDQTEKERVSLAKELHEGPVQQVFGISYLLRSLVKSLPEIRQETGIFLLLDELSKINTTLRDITRSLRPSTLEPFGLAKTIAEQAARLKKRHPELDVQLALMQDEQQISTPVRLALYRIYQVAVQNTLEHAHARKLSITFNLDAEFAYLEIQDDGVGFEVPESWMDFARSGRLGLAGALERLEAVGGALEVQSRPGQGTLVRATAPKS